MIGDTQQETEFVEVETFIYSFLLKKAGSSIPSATKFKFFNTASLDFM